MSDTQTFRQWLFSAPPEERTVGRVVLWWESRRIPYNLIVAGVGIVSLVVFFICIDSSGTLRPGDDEVEPLSLVFGPPIAAILINICYSAGAITELVLRLVLPRQRALLGPLLFKIGFHFSLFVVTSPALFG